MIPDPFIRDRAGADPLIEGYYLLERRRAGRIDVPMRVWFGPPVDEDGEEMDRSPRWQIQIGFALLEEEELRIGGIWIRNLDDIWPVALKNPIDEAEWNYRLDRHEWAAAYDQHDAFSEIGGKIDPLTVSLP